MDKQDLINKIQETMNRLKLRKRKLTSGKIYTNSEEYRGFSLNQNKDQRNLAKLFKQLLPERCEDCVGETRLFYNCIACYKYKNSYAS